MNKIDFGNFHSMDDGSEKLDMLISTLILEKAKRSWYEQNKEKIARTAMLAGVPYEVIERITGLGIDTIRTLA